MLPLAAYAALGDGRSVALVGTDGSVDWWCVPNMDSDPLFDRLLDDAAGGYFVIAPVDAFTTERRYRPDSNVLETVFVTAGGRVRLTDSLNSGISGRLPWSELGRRIEGIAGEVELRIEIRTGRRLDCATPWREPSPHGDVLHVDGLMVAMRSDGGVERTEERDDGLTARLLTRAGGRSLVALLVSGNEPLILPALESIDARIDRSDQAWREWCGGLTIDMAHAASVRRSALALKLLLFSPTGATAAAATMALPERIGGDKNYDYRYAWVRDVALTIKAFLRVGATEEAKAAFSWLMATVRRHPGQIRTMYRLDGDLAPEQEALDLPGYADSRPVLRGNKARSQLQLGVFGDVLETALLFGEAGHVLDLATRRLLTELTDRCADLWRHRDSGIWELEAQEHYTTSKMSCWSALDCAVILAGRGQIDASHVERWKRERDRIRDWTNRECWSAARQAYTMFPGTDRLDAAVLLQNRFVKCETGRFATTRDAIVAELADGPLVYRYSGAQREEATFLACAFWLVETSATLGDREMASSWMEALLGACCGELGLLTEQMDARSGAMLGNVPQALSHLALIHAASSLSEVRRAE